MINFLQQFFNMLYQYQKVKFDMKCNFEKLKMECQKILIDYKNKKNEQH